MKIVYFAIFFNIPSLNMCVSFLYKQLVSTCTCIFSHHILTRALITILSFIRGKMILRVK